MTSVELNRSAHRFVKLICYKMIIVVAIVSSAVSWTMVNWNNIMQILLSINQRWAGDRLAGFVKAVLKECSCSMALVAG